MTAFRSNVFSSVSCLDHVLKSFSRRMVQEHQSLSPAFYKGGILKKRIVFEKMMSASVYKACRWHTPGRSSKWCFRMTAGTSSFKNGPCKWPNQRCLAKFASPVSTSSWNNKRGHTMTCTPCSWAHSPNLDSSVEFSSSRPYWPSSKTGRRASVAFNNADLSMTE